MSQEARALRELFSNTARQSNAIEIVLLYDSSGSVCTKDFKLSLESGASLLKVFGDNVKFAFGQFSCKFYLECALTSDKNLLAAKHAAVARKSGGTNTTEALQESEKLFFNAPERIIYLFTDGHPNNQRSCVAVGRSLLSKGIKIFGVGIGSVNRASLQEFCTHVFILSNYTELLQAIPAPPPPTVIPNSEIILSFIQLRRPISSTEKLPLRVEIENVSSVTVKKDSLVMFTPKGENFYHKCSHILPVDIVRGASYHFDVNLRPMGTGTNWSAIPSDIYVTVTPPDSSLPYFSKISGFGLDIQNMIKDLYLWRPTMAPNLTANILVFGWVGAGKSSLVNAILTSFFDSLQSFASVLNSSSHVTLNVEGYDLSLLNNISVRFKFYDTPGLTLSSYNSQKFSQILASCEASSTEILTPSQPPVTDDSNSQGILCNYNTLLEQYKNQNNSSSSSSSKRIHTVIFVMPQGISEDGNALVRLRSFIEQSTSEGMNCLLVVTKIDEVPIQYHEKVVSKFEQTGITRDRIFLVDNHPKNTEKSFERDKLMISILKNALNRADDYIMRFCADPNYLSQNNNNSSSSSINSSSYHFQQPQNHSNTFIPTQPSSYTNSSYSNDQSFLYQTPQSYSSFQPTQPNNFPAYSNNFSSNTYQTANNFQAYDNQQHTNNQNATTDSSSSSSALEHLVSAGVPEQIASYLLRKHNNDGLKAIMEWHQNNQ